ncbi:MAG TPA: hypothetical protein VIA81_08170 [Acidimicrobiia bacterium]|jgi:hypothetical protein
MDDLNRRLSEHGNLLLHDDPLTLEQVRMRMAAEDELAVNPRPRPWFGSGRMPPLALAVGVGLIVLLLFVPQMLMRSPDDETITEETVPVVSTPTSVANTIETSEFTSTTKTRVGVIGWVDGPVDLRDATLHLVDGVYYANYRNEAWGWEQSTDGSEWTPTFSPLGSMSSEYTGAGWGQAVFEIDGETWATVSRLEPTPGPIRLLKREAGEWVEVRFDHVRPPEGVTFVGETNRLLPNFPRTEYTSVVVHDGELLMIRKPDSSGDDMVLLGSEIFALSVADEPGGPRVILWRSGDGLDWHETDLPDIDTNGDMALGAGGGRLMLTARVPVGTSMGQVVMTSDDGRNWVPAQGLPETTFRPIFPQPSDFGWVASDAGTPWSSSGLYNPKLFRILISADGVDWEQVRPPGAPGGLIAGALIPVTHEAGLWVRDLRSLDRDYSLVGRVID